MVSFRIRESTIRVSLKKVIIFIINVLDITKIIINLNARLGIEFKEFKCTNMIKPVT